MYLSEPQWVSLLSDYSHLVTKVGKAKSATPSTPSTSSGIQSPASDRSSEEGKVLAGEDPPPLPPEASSRWVCGVSRPREGSSGAARARRGKDKKQATPQVHSSEVRGSSPAVEPPAEDTGDAKEEQGEEVRKEGGEPQSEADRPAAKGQRGLRKGRGTTELLSSEK
eukprot:Sspe_Gene.98032::Locus_71499_Transcript_1_1_Confidence_1.000_Length_500::g.98032::m.98032